MNIIAFESLWSSGIGSRLGRNRLWVRFLAVSDIYPMFIEPTITWVPSGFSGYIWLDFSTAMFYFTRCILFSYFNSKLFAIPASEYLLMQNWGRVRYKYLPTLSIISSTSTTIYQPFYETQTSVIQRMIDECFICSMLVHHHVSGVARAPQAPRLRGLAGMKGPLGRGARKSSLRYCIMLELSKSIFDESIT